MAGAVLGISCYYHDAAAALIVDGQVIACAEEERFTRVKHDSRFPTNAIRFCLDHAGVDPGDLALVVFYESPTLKLDRILETCFRNFPRANGLFAAAMRGYLANRYWIKSKIKKTLCPSAQSILMSQHHLSHAASAFYPCPFEEAAIVTLDGVGEWNTATVAVGRGTDIYKISETNYPHSIGLLYSAFTSFIGFQVNEGEYKLMGLAPYGRPTRYDDVRNLVRLLPEGRFELDLEYFAWEYSTERLYTDKFLALFGDPRPLDTELDFESSDESGTTGLQPYADIAASIQKVTEDLVLHVVRYAHERTGLDALCLAGGVALNSVANHRIREETPFRRLFAQPAAGDSGGALGAALLGHCTHLGGSRPTGPFSPYLGSGVDDHDARAFLDAQATPYKVHDDEASLYRRVARSLADNKVVGWCQGRAEWGPRALGNRSILANPAHPEMKRIINSKVKFREPFRPFAPAILEERVGEFFLVDGYSGAVDAAYTPLYYMLEVLEFRPEHRARFPAVVHVDGTGRVQAVSKRLNPRFWNLISEFDRITGVPMVLNTSFNLKGEPIVDTVADAFDTFLRTGIDELVIGNIVVTR